MGIYDREYYRGEAGGPGWFGGVAPWCKTLIVINCVVFLLQNALRADSDFISDWLEASPEGIFQHGRIWQLWTATFLHADILHILGNMWFLWLVGREMESLYGSRDFLAFYLLAGGRQHAGLGADPVALRPGMTIHMVGRLRRRDGRGHALHALLSPPGDPLLLLAHADVGLAGDLPGLAPVSRPRTRESPTRPT